MAKPGRKSYTEELNIAQRYSDLTEPFFKVIKKHLESGDDNKERWAVEQLSKAFVKMIPQDMTSGGRPLVLQFDNALKSKFTSETD